MCSHDGVSNLPYRHNTSIGGGMRFPLLLHMLGIVDQFGSLLKRLLSGLWVDIPKVRYSEG